MTREPKSSTARRPSNVKRGARRVAGRSLDDLWHEVALNAAGGLSESEIEAECNLAPGELQAMSVRYPELAEALQIGRESARFRVERSIYERAIGPTTVIKRVHNRKGELVRTVEETRPGDWRAGAAYLQAHDPSGMWGPGRSRRPHRVEVPEVIGEPQYPNELARELIELLESGNPQR
jgi:hypothetical protein